jgi:DNA-binding CsgD family transcriptional regulator
VLPAFLALYILAFSLGIVILTLSVLAYKRSGHASYRHFSVLFTGTMIYIIGDTFDLYEKVFRGLFNGVLPYIDMGLSAAANGIIAFMTPVLVFGLVDLKVSRLRMGLQIAATVVLVGLGAADDLFPHTVLPVMDAVALAGVQLYGIWILMRNFKRIGSSPLKSLIRSAAAYVSVMFVLMIVALLVRSLPGSPHLLREYGVTQVAFYLGAMIMILVYATRFLFQTDTSVPTLLPDRFIEQYGISPRECEIISMILRGYGNRKIGETLFISAMTVKNHIYHIYRKTGVENKVQLLNIINSRE